MLQNAVLIMLIAGILYPLFRGLWKGRNETSETAFLYTKIVNKKAQKVAKELDK